MNGEEARKLAEDAIRDLGAQLEQGQSTAMKEYLDVMARFPSYSWGNCLLIAAQRPGARHVQGFRAWQRLGRYVRKGEHGIVIMAPIVRRTQADDPDKTEERVVAFKAAHVFDEVQTDGRPLPQPTQVGGDPGDCVERLKAFVARRGIELECANNLGGADGEASKGRIALRSGLAPAHAFSVLAHEVAHCLLHFGADRDQLSKAVRETEAEAVAYVVCKSVGLDTNTAAADYVLMWQGDVKTLSGSLQRIRETASEIITAVRDFREAMPQMLSSMEPGRNARRESTCSRRPDGITVG